MELVFPPVVAVRDDGILKLGLELLQDLLGFLHRPVDAVDLVGAGPVVEHVLRAHQLDHGLEAAGLPDVAALVLHDAAHHELLRPVHVAGGEPVAASGELGSDVRSSPGVFVGRSQRTVGVGGVQAGLVLVARVDAGSLHVVSEHIEGEGGVASLHLLKQLQGIQ